MGQGDVLMEFLPPVGWADVATKPDLDALASRLECRFDRLDDRFAQQTAEIIAIFGGEITAAVTLHIRQTVFAIIGVLLAVTALLAVVLGLG